MEATKGDGNTFAVTEARRVKRVDSLAAAQAIIGALGRGDRATETLLPPADVSTAAWI